MRKEVTMRACMAFTARSFLLRLALAAVGIFVCLLPARAGGPNRVAGTSYFAATATGQPLTWPGAISYFTDQGDLSPILPNSAANTLVANAFSVWTAAPTAAIAPSSGGQLGEDVNGTNVYRNSDGSISMPSDIQSSATGTPIGIVYDYDGSVTDALIGSGAGDSSQCFFNAVFGGNDNFGTLATYQHGLIVINGQCALASAQILEVQYRLERTIGTVLGLGWSQLNLNVIVGNPRAASDDYAGFPLMHYSDPTMCVPITKCYPNPTALAMDDVAALSRLYPVTSQNQSSFPGKQVFSSTTGSIHGSVWFTDKFGNRLQPMQGVNVVARWIDPSTGLPSRRYAASSVSGFLFTGNEGNPITGGDDDLGNPYAEWGSENSSVEGFFDLAGLQIPSGRSAQYQLTIEAVNSLWSQGVGPYAPNPVSPSGTAQPIVVTVSAGSDAQQDILMTNTAQPVPSWAASKTWTDPAQVPIAGDWIGSLGTYDETDYFLLTAQANRSLSVAVTALDESGSPSEVKMEPVIGMWTASDSAGTPPPAFTVSPFNSIPAAMTRLDVQINASTNFLVGIADFRGDGRPDYHYHAQILYGDRISPSRVSVGGGPVAVLGTGFSPRLTANIGSGAATVLEASAGQLLLSVPQQSDGPQSLTLTDPTTGGTTTLSGALTYGAAASDNIYLLTYINPQTPVGAQAVTPITVQVLAADGVTPVSGATVGWSATNNLKLSACGGASSCSVATDQSGLAITWLTPAALGAATITATLAPGVYSPPKSVTAGVNAIESISDISVLTPLVWIAQGATLSVPITARVLSNGIPQASATVNFTLVTGAGTLTSSSAQTNSNGNATTSLSLNQFASGVQVNACVAPANAPCQAFYANPIAVSQINLQPVSGFGQISSGQTFQPVIVRVVDSASPPHSVLGVIVNFQNTVLRPSGSGQSSPSNPAMQVILSVNQTVTLSDVNGLASIAPSSNGFGGPVEVDVTASTGTSMLDCPLQLLPTPAGGDIPLPSESRVSSPVVSQPSLRFHLPFSSVEIHAHD